MRNIQVIEGNSDTYYSSDTRRIVGAMAAQGYRCSETEARMLWERYSDSMCAGWMMLPETDRTIVACIAAYFDVVGEPE